MRLASSSSAGRAIGPRPNIGWPGRDSAAPGGSVCGRGDPARRPEPAQAPALSSSRPGAHGARPAPLQRGPTGQRNTLALPSDCVIGGQSVTQSADCSRGRGGSGGPASGIPGRTSVLSGMSGTPAGRAVNPRLLACDPTSDSLDWQVVSLGTKKFCGEPSPEARDAWRGLSPGRELIVVAGSPSPCAAERPNRRRCAALSDTCARQAANRRVRTPAPFGPRRSLLRWIAHT